MKLIGILILLFSIVSVASNSSDGRVTISAPSPIKDLSYSLPMPSGDGRYHPLHFSKDDLYYMTEALYFEAATEPRECQLMVAHVIVGREMDERWDSTIKGVIWAKYQFSYTHDGKPETMIDLDARKRLEQVAIEVLGGHSADNSVGSLYYYNPKLANPDWDWSKIEKAKSCGDHDFYRDRDFKGDF